MLVPIPPGQVSGMKKRTWAAIVGLAVVVAVVVAWSGRDRREVQLSDGSRLRFHGATFGIQSAPKPRFRSAWTDRFASRLPAVLQRFLPPPNAQLASSWTLGEETLPVVTIWFSHIAADGRTYLETPGPAKLRPVQGELVMFGGGSSDRLPWGDDTFFLLGWTLKNGSALFLGQTNLVSFEDRWLEFDVLDLQDQVIRRVGLPNPARGRRPAP